MQNSVVNIIKDLEGVARLDTQLSFRGFIGFLKARRLMKKTQKVKYLDFLVHHFEERLKGKDLLEPEEMQQYVDLLELMYGSIFPPIADERDNLWALGIPMKPVIIYGTDSFYDLLLDPASGKLRASMIDPEEKERHKLNMDTIYSVILNRLYSYSVPTKDTMIRSWKNESTGLPSYYRLNIDTRFVEVFSKGPLPEVDPELFQSHRSRAEILDWLMEHLPLEGFQFRGINAITVTDVTKSYVMNKIRGLLLDPSTCDEVTPQDDVMRYLQILCGTMDADFGLMPFLKVNGRPVFSGESCHHSVLAKAAQTESQQEAYFVGLVQNYFLEPRLILYETLPPYQQEEPYFLASLRRVGLKAYGLLPVYHNSRLVGLLEVSSHKTGVLDQALLSRLDEVLPLLAQLLQRSSEEFDERIKVIVKENFTSLQPAVEWKFYEAAWEFEQARQTGESPVVETIYFKDVFPLYGAVDIRNSTIERNRSLQQDLRTQFGLLTDTLKSLQMVVDLELLEEMIYQSGKWEEALEGGLTTADELKLNVFLTEEAAVFLEHFRHSRPDTEELLLPYWRAVDPASGKAFKDRRELEVSIQLINQTINEHLDSATESLQRSFPCYFEKFRTDGVEYDIYAGQAIAPDRPFDVLYLHNLRLWQLHSMVKIARLTEALQPQLPVGLQTTQLIFVHSSAIDISFRKDERRFDVEGGYNIRYQVVKKRIDKVHVRDTGERLTQPGTVAIIYFNEKEAEEYAGYIKYLQEKECFRDEIEYLELEELQGVSGLRALRVKVNFLPVGEEVPELPVEIPDLGVEGNDLGVEGKELAAGAKEKIVG
jgi:GAF domain-containing protein